MRLASAGNHLRGAKKQRLPRVDIGYPPRENTSSEDGRTLRVLRSYLTALRASGGLGRATKLERQGEALDALRVAREALSLLGARHVVRDNPGEAAVLVNLTMLVDHLASQLGQPGAARADLVDSVRVLERFGDNGDAKLKRMRTEWLPHLRGRLMQGPAE
jgi:hypothetical protein